MKVKQLIDRLSVFDIEAEVMIQEKTDAFFPETYYYEIKEISEKYLEISSQGTIVIEHV